MNLTTIGRRFLDVAPNTEGLCWVDFTVLEMFPPQDVCPAARYPGAPGSLSAGKGA